MKKDFKPLYYFMMGVAFFQLLLPLLTSLVETVTVIFDGIKAPRLLSIAKINRKIQSLSEEENVSQTHAIGFEIPNEEEYFEKEED